MANDILNKAKSLLAGKETKQIGNTDYKMLPGRVEAALANAKGLDVYIAFDTTGSMDQYIRTVRKHIKEVSDALIVDKSDIRISINGFGDHCDGENWIQMYALSRQPQEIKSCIDQIVMTNGGDAPEAYECAASAFAKRMIDESNGRKKAFIMIGDSYPHGIEDMMCPHADYKESFMALRTTADEFYFVGCDSSTYNQQKSMIEKSEQFVPLGNMVSVLPNLLIALAKKSESSKALREYMQLLENNNPDAAKKIKGLLTG